MGVQPIFGNYLGFCGNWLGIDWESIRNPLGVPGPFLGII